MSLQIMYASSEYMKYIYYKYIYEKNNLHYTFNFQKKGRKFSPVELELLVDLIEEHRIPLYGKFGDKGTKHV